MQGGRRGGKQAALDIETVRTMAQAYIDTPRTSVGVSEFLKFKTGWPWSRLDRAMKALRILDEQGHLRIGWMHDWDSGR